MQEMKEKELKSLGNGDANSHMCKVCFESPTAAILLPCRHFYCKSLSNSITKFSHLNKLFSENASILMLAVCKSCSLACSECPICRTKISDRLFAFPSWYTTYFYPPNEGNVNRFFFSFLFFSFSYEMLTIFFTYLQGFVTTCLIFSMWEAGAILSLVCM